MVKVLDAPNVDKSVTKSAHSGRPGRVTWQELPPPRRPVNGRRLIELLVTMDFSPASRLIVKKGNALPQVHHDDAATCVGVDITQDSQGRLIMPRLMSPMLRAPYKDRAVLSRVIARHDIRHDPRAATPAGQEWKPWRAEAIEQQAAVVPTITLKTIRPERELGGHHQASPGRTCRTAICGSCLARPRPHS